MDTYTMHEAYASGAGFGELSIPSNHDAQLVDIDEPIVSREHADAWASDADGDLSACAGGDVIEEAADLVGRIRQNAGMESVYAWRVWSGHAGMKSTRASVLVRWIVRVEGSE